MAGLNSCTRVAPFRVFDKLKNEIQKFMSRFRFYLNMKNEIQIKEFLMLSFVFHFLRNGHAGTKNPLLRKLRLFCCLYFWLPTSIATAI